MKRRLCLTVDFLCLLAGAMALAVIFAIEGFKVLWAEMTKCYSDKGGSKT